ncbi:uncharacterized protein LOC127854580 [Dreissena polymorpha]|uniref:uncharacterized protein LOC127854580 n=1 Tax=Dreissena polymorpha TaxID=45954 RepID=UPI002264B088|nr:uncharacterized protein LOC127854580 [Dreissena polymorpha]
MRLNIKWKVLIGILIPVVVLYFLLTRHTTVVKLPIKDGLPCNTTLGQSHEKNLEKIRTYMFSKAEPYLKSLFVEVDDNKMPDVPVFVTAFSSSHFSEGQDLIKNVNSVARKQFPSAKFFIYDIGLSSSHQKQILSDCNCEIKPFDFTSLPAHVSIMKGYAWKPLVIQSAAKQHPFVVWMDASVRFTTRDLKNEFKDVQRVGVKASEGYAPIAVRTHPNTFRFLQEEACAFKELNEFEATFIMIYGTKFVSEFLLRPWVSCALAEGCLVPDHSPSEYINCDNPTVYFDCHRFDQSVLSILLHRMYSKDIEEHKMKHEFYKFCKGADEIPFVPQFLNKIYSHYYEKCM